MSDWILVVDDDTSNLKMANRILSGENLRVSCLKSGEDATKFLQENRPDLILLDVHMPGMNGFDTIAAIRENKETADIPVIFLTADDDSNTEKKGLEAGAMDFIKKPFVPEVLLLRVRHTIELIRLQTNLAYEVEKKTQEVTAQHEKLEKISRQIATTLSGAIDAKDTYTNGHSTRVAEYSREISRRAGFSEEVQDEIYMMGLLHDVGKIGIPDAIINKPAKLTDEEYSIIQKHPVTGAKILKNITEFPKLSNGARWHHERYDGKGYPDGIAGEEIPTEARIIAVADAYDAMSSRRSYRDVLPQAKVREEVEKGKGTQFDPVFAEIMLSMIDEDRDYQMREK
ncbi:MAG: response regulator [Lachnospiraceae bacterium]|nr:response regulator [Lachnospiraceae bacterium]MDY5520463.1 response regulator [Agathobacter sp.]